VVFTFFGTLAKEMILLKSHRDLATVAEKILGK